MSRFVHGDKVRFNAEHLTVFAAHKPGDVVIIDCYVYDLLGSPYYRIYFTADPDNINEQEYGYANGTKLERVEEA